MACRKNLLHHLAVMLILSTDGVISLARRQQLKQSINRVVRVPYNAKGHLPASLLINLLHGGE